MNLHIWNALGFYGFTENLNKFVSPPSCYSCKGHLWSLSHNCLVRSLNREQFLAAIGALYVTMSVSRSVGRSDGRLNGIYSA